MKKTFFTRTIRLAFFLLLSCVLSMSALAGPGFWSGNGFYGGSVYRIVADPVTPGVFYATTDDTIYKTSDNGLSWSRRDSGLQPGSINPYSLAHHPINNDTAYVFQINTLYKTTDGGANWLPASTISTPPGIGIWRLLIAPDAPETMIAISWNENAFYHSSDGGLTWATRSISNASEGIRALAINPANADQLWAVTADNSVWPPVFRWYASVDGGMTWSDESAALSACCSTEVTDIKIDAAGSVIYLTGPAGQAKSIDGGASWNAIGTYNATSLLLNPADSNELYLAGTDGVIHSTDGGVTWTPFRATFAANEEAVAQSTAGLFSPHDPGTVLVGTYANGVYRKTVISPAFSPSNLGLAAANVHALAIHPGNTDYVLAGRSDPRAPSQSFFFSPNGGLDWLPASSGPNAQLLQSIVIDPNTTAAVNTTVVYASGLKVGENIDFSGNIIPTDGGIYKSTDGGNTWSVIDTDLPLSPWGFSWLGTVRDLALDPSSGAGGGSGPLQTIFAVGSGSFTDNGGTYTKQAARIYKSTNAGASWSPADTGMAEAELIDGQWQWPRAVQIEIDPANPAIMYVATFLGLSGTSTPPTLGNGVWKSTDGGASWNLSSNGLPRVAGAGSSHFDVLSLAIDPSNPDTLYASAHDPATLESVVYKSVDAGANWAPANTGITSTDVRDILVDTDGHVYAAVVGRPGNPGGVYRSTDGGASWHAISVGLEGGATAFTLAIDESGSNKILYAGTGFSVQRIELLPDADLDGVPDTAEASAPGGGDGNADGTPDNVQGQVATVDVQPLAVRETANEVAATTQITIEITPISGNCNRLENVEALDNTQVPVFPGRDFPYGVIRFEIVDCQQAQVRLIHHAAGGFGSGWTLSLFAPATPGEDLFTWQDYPSASTTGNQWLFTLTDGQFGDVRPANGRILFQGGAGFQDLIFQNGF